MGHSEDFKAERLERLHKNEMDEQLSRSAREFLVESIRASYSYNFEWLSRPIIQYPQDVVALQEIIWAVRPDLIIETGIAHGGSLIFSASMLALLDYCEAAEHGHQFDTTASSRKVVGIDIEIRRHNRDAIRNHPLGRKIELIEGSSTAAEVVARVHELAMPQLSTLVILDSNHTHDHVLGELNSYAPLVSQGSYCVVLDTIIEHLPDGMFPNR